MPPQFIRVRRRHFVRRLVAGSCLVAHLALAIGFPLTARPVVAGRSKPYPCQHHQCGCHSADQCWRSCCCMTMQQKLAWARKHGVTPPDFVLAAAQPEADQTRPAGCCATLPQVSHRTPLSKPACGSCCAQSSSGGALDEGEPTTRQESAVHWVLGVRAQRCRGLTAVWLAAGAALLSMPTGAPADLSPPLWWCPVIQLDRSALAWPPEAPPPRQLGPRFA